MILKHWTLDEEELLRSMIAAGQGPDEIAIKLQRSVSAVHARAFVLRISFRRAQAKIVKRLKAKK